MAETQTPALDALLDAMLPHVAFDGWSPVALAVAVDELGLSEAEAKALAPRGAIDLAVAYHRRGDLAMLERLESSDLDDMRFRDKVATALRFRVEAMDDREAVRRASTLFSLPVNAAEGARLVWETADHVRKALGDTSEDGNWYSKRATLSAVWASVVLYWLGDDSPGFQKTYEFIDRRIENVMQVEKMKGQLRANPLTKPLMDLQASFFSRMHPPKASEDVPGRWNP